MAPAFYFFIFSKPGLHHIYNKFSSIVKAFGEISFFVKERLAILLVMHFKKCNEHKHKTSLATVLFHLNHISIIKMKTFWIHAWVSRLFKVY